MIKRLLASYYISIARGYAQSCTFDRALSMCKRALLLDTNFVEALALRGWIRSAHLQEIEGLDELSRAVSLAPDVIEPRRYRADAYCTLGFYDQAIEDANFILSVKPNHVDALITRGTAYRRTKQYDKALADISNALTVQPRNLDLAQMQAFIYESLGDYERAMAIYDVLISINFRVANFYFYRAQLHKQLNNETQARSDYTRALKLNPNLPREMLSVAVARGKQDREGAIRNLKDLEALCEEPSLRNVIAGELQAFSEDSKIPEKICES